MLLEGIGVGIGAGAMSGADPFGSVDAGAVCRCDLSARARSSTLSPPQAVRERPTIITREARVASRMCAP